VEPALEFESPVRWVVEVYAGFGGVAQGFECGFRESIMGAAVGSVAVTASSDGIRASFELDGSRRDEVQASAWSIVKAAMVAGSTSVPNGAPGPHGWNVNMSVEPAPPRR
jgi:hypothetical protein